MSAERVHGILRYYDEILDGVADFEGTPHAFVLDGDPASETPRYRLKALTADEFNLFKEHWQMWCRWEAAAHRGEVPIPTTPGSPAVLAVDRERYDDIEASLKIALAVPQTAGHLALGAFRR